LKNTTGLCILPLSLAPSSASSATLDRKWPSSSSSRR
jgi:hypothetical protein